MCHDPLASTDAKFLNLAITATDEDEIIDHLKSHEAIAGKWHGGSIYPIVYAEDADLTSTGSKQQSISLRKGEGVLAVETCVRQLASALLQVVLHRGEIELEGVDENVRLVRCHDDIGRMLRVLVSEDVSPADNVKGELVHSGVDG